MTEGAPAEVEILLISGSSFDGGGGNLWGDRCANQSPRRLDACTIGINHIRDLTSHTATHTAWSTPKFEFIEEVSYLSAMVNWLLKWRGLIPIWEGLEISRKII